MFSVEKNNNRSGKEILLVGRPINLILKVTPSIQQCGKKGCAQSIGGQIKAFNTLPVYMEINIILYLQVLFCIYSEHRIY